MKILAYKIKQILFLYLPAGAWSSVIPFQFLVDFYDNQFSFAIFFLYSKILSVNHSSELIQSKN